MFIQVLGCVSVNSPGGFLRKRYVSVYRPSGMMLALTESDSRKPAAKRQKGKKRSKQDHRGQKRAMLTIEKELEDKEELQMHELMPVPYKPEEHDLEQAEVHFEQANVTEQDCQSVATISCMDSVQNSNKFVIITLLEPDAQGLAGGQLLDKDKKVILLHKIDDQGTATLEASPETDPLAGKDDIKTEFEGPLMTINFSDFAASTTDSKEQRADIGDWIKNFESLSLLYTESGKPYVKCPACTAMFFKVSSFEKHVSCHLQKEEERYVCNYCKYDNEDASTIFTHLLLHQDQCEVCNMNLTRKNSFKKHWDLSEISEFAMMPTMKRDRWGRFVCVYCKLGFDLSHQLQKHWFKHSCSSQKTSQCNNCTGLFDNDEALQNHVCLKCPVCGKICDSVHRLRSHTRYEKHYLYCQICTYEFILAVDHEKHMELHKKIYHTQRGSQFAHCLKSEDGLSFQCELCGKIYHTMSCLVLHINDDHKIPEANELARISLPEDKDGAASFDIITTLKGELKCEEVDFERACEEVLEAQTESAAEEPNDSKDNQGDEQCEPVALCWNRYSIEDDESSVRKAA